MQSRSQVHNSGQRRQIILHLAHPSATRPRTEDDQPSEGPQHYVGERERFVLFVRKTKKQLKWYRHTLIITF